MNDNIESKIILITKVEQKTSNAVIFDQDNKKYTIWYSKSTGGETVAYSFYKRLEKGGLNQNVEISFKSEQKEYQGKEYTARTIIAMKESKQQPISSKAIGQVNAKSLEKDEQDKWDRLGWAKCKTLFLVEAFKQNRDLETIEKTAEDWADACTRKLSDNKAMKNIQAVFGEDLKTINVEDEPPTYNDLDIPVGSIPF